jgi:hypothetical protein
LNLPVCVEDIGDVDADVRVAQTRSLTPKNCRHSWIQCSYIIYVHLHPNIGGIDIKYTCKLTGVKNNTTLLGWLSKPSLVSCGHLLVAFIKPVDLLSVILSEFWECFNIIDNTSTVSLK